MRQFARRGLFCARAMPSSPQGHRFTSFRVRSRFFIMASMQIIHRISISTTPEIRKELSSLGVVVGEGLVTFEVDETHKSWRGLKLWIDERRAVDIVTTKFSNREIAHARWLELVPTWHHGYPQPEDNFGYREVTYDRSEYCAQCGIGAKQKAPFR